MARFEDVFDKPMTDKPLANRFAVHLREILVKKLKSKSTWSENNWANDFRMLLQATSEARVVVVLEWYDKHCDTPSPYPLASAKGFRKHFDVLESKALKEIDQINISDEAKEIAAKVIKAHHWPYPALDNIPAAVQESIANYVPLKIDLKNWLAVNEKTVRPSIAGFVRLVQSRLSCRGFRPVETFCLQWFTTIHHDIDGWREWFGNFAKYVFRKDGDWTNQLGRGWAFGYDASGKLWDYLKNEVWVSKN